MIRKAITTASLLIAAILALAWLTPSQSHTEPVFTPAPSATPSLPSCLTEDGAGMALCTWDAQTQGNGQGASVISGDCAPAVMDGDTEAQRDAASVACRKLHVQPSTETTYADGTVATWPNGADLVAECADENRGMTNEEKAENGFTLIGCFMAQMAE